MEKKKIDKIIEIFRHYIQLKEDGISAVGPTMSTGSTVNAGGFSGSADPKGPTAGFDPVIGFKKRKGPQIKLSPGSRNRWKKPE